MMMPTFYENDELPHKFIPTNTTLSRYFYGLVAHIIATYKYVGI